MEQNFIDSVALAGSVGDVDISIMALFMQAHWVVKIVMVILVLASIWTWAIILEKSFRLRRLHARASKFEDAFWSGGSLEDLYERVAPRSSDPMSALFVAGMREWRRSSSRGLGQAGVGRARLQERIDRVMNVALSREMERTESNMTFLASVGSTAPFVGLFGTVWGIMNAFQAIAVTKQTSLAVVAPGIAEALLATALGLVAAIPAVVAYNKLSNDINRYGGRLEAFNDEFSAIMSRQLEESA